MSGFLSKITGLFGGGSNEPSAPKDEKVEIYQDCRIIPRPIKEGSQWRLAGVIQKEVDGVLLERTVVRADLLSSREEASNFMIRKAQQVIDQNRGLFADGEAKGNA